MHLVLRFFSCFSFQEGKTQSSWKKWFYQDQLNQMMRNPWFGRPIYFPVWMYFLNNQTSQYKLLEPWLLDIVFSSGKLPSLLDALISPFLIACIFVRCISYCPVACYLPDTTSPREWTNGVLLPALMLFQLIWYTTVNVSCFILITEE